MKIFKYLFILIWRIWFYAWFLLSIIPVFPILIIVTSREKWYPVFFKIARAWAKTILFVMGFKIELEEEQFLEKEKNFIFCPNHTSMIDIFVMLAITKNPFVFVGKIELTKIPIFGFFYKRTCIIVDRSDSKSRKSVFDNARIKLNGGLDICIFPEGLVPDDENVVLSDFKIGAFRLAIEYQMPIVPITMYDCKKLFSYTFFSGSPGTLGVKVHPMIQTEGLTLKDKNFLKKQTFDIIYKELISDINNIK